MILFHLEELSGLREISARGQKLVETGIAQKKKQGFCIGFCIDLGLNLALPFVSFSLLFF